MIIPCHCTGSILPGVCRPDDGSGALQLQLSALLRQPRVRLLKPTLWKPTLFDSFLTSELPLASDEWRRLGVLAHTVQMYTFDDPAPTYGQKNFMNMYDYTLIQAPHRYTLYHGETAYWVNYDIDVPLFLPLYASARLQDLRRLAKAEKEKGIQLMGQSNFESGWEWGYWLPNVITARAAWNPRDPSLSENQALYEALSDGTKTCHTRRYC